MKFLVSALLLLTAGGLFAAGVYIQDWPEHSSLTTFVSGLGLKSLGCGTLLCEVFRWK